ncbi:MAG TPA: Wzz/FepE/Etk N-terminal domain-containing protein [Bacteroidota bacterium]|nr:Wzz/FepE/Etk N-terminal domain-containing protein [Bacteroidota bacterium]
MAENFNQASSRDRSSSVRLLGIISLLIKKKKFISFATAGVTIAAIIISLILPESFRSTSVILPETDKSKLAGLGGLADLVSMAGVGPGETSPVKLYPVILKSEAVLKPVIYKKYQTVAFKDSVNLIEFFKIRKKTPALEYEKTLELLRENLEVSMDYKTSVITLMLETEEPQLTADIINSITAGLDIFMRTKRTTHATHQRQWIEARLGEVKQDLASSENRMMMFREKNRSIAGSPLLILEQDRLARDVQINSTLFIELKKQFELIKIEEIKNMPIINVMDPAIPAAKKNKPTRSIIVLSSFMIAFVSSISYVVLQHEFGEKVSAYFKALKHQEL